MSIYVERVTYINSQGEKLEFGRDGLYLEESPIHAWSFATEQKNKRIVNLYQDILSFPLNAQIITDSDAQANAIRNKMHDVFYIDAVNHQYGQLICEGYTLQCWVTASEHTDYTDWLPFGDVKLTVTTDRPAWIKESSWNFTMGETSGEPYGFDYPYDFEFDYELITHKFAIRNPALLPSDFRLIIFGPVSKPELLISNHAYGVDVVVEEGEYLTIDSKTRAIVLTQKNGATVNCFHLRNRDSYIFQKIAPAEHTVYFDSAMNCRLILRDERGEPKWT